MGCLVIKSRSKTEDSAHKHRIRIHNIQNNRSERPIFIQNTCNAYTSFICWYLRQGGPMRAAHVGRQPRTQKEGNVLKVKISGHLKNVVATLPYRATTDSSAMCTVNDLCWWCLSAIFSKGNNLARWSLWPLATHLNFQPKLGYSSNLSQALTWKLKPDKDLGCVGAWCLGNSNITNIITQYNLELGISLLYKSALRLRIWT